MRACGLALAVCLQISLAAGQAPSTGAGDWRQWRGPARNGVVSGALPDAWPAALTKRWEVSVGAGHSSPVVSGNRVVVMSRAADREVVRALDLATGREIWKTDYAAPYSVNPAAMGHGPGPKSTPVIAGGRVFTFGIGGVLSALDLATGKLLWRTPPPAVLPEYGTVSSPIVQGDLVIAHVGGYNNGAISAFDAAKGTERWRWNGDGPGYASPVMTTVAGVRHLVTITQKFIVGLNVADGTLLWRQPFTTEYNQNSVTPLAFGDVVIYSGINKPTTAVRIARKGGAWTAEPIWTNDQLPMFMSSPVIVGNTLFGLSHRNRGQLFALDVATGKTLWTTKGRDGENASILASASSLLAATTNGELIVAKIDPAAFKESRRYKIADSAVWAHPAIAGRSILIKDADKLICWRF